MNPSSQGYRIRQEERWVCWSVVGDDSCSCNGCSSFLLLILYDTHEKHTLIGNIHVLITTCWIFMSGDVGMWASTITSLVRALTSRSGAITAATSRKSECVINNCLQLWVCSAQLCVARLDCWVCAMWNLIPAPWCPVWLCWVSRIRRPPGNDRSAGAILGLLVRSYSLGPRSLWVSHKGSA